MKLDEAIAHARQKAKEMRILSSANHEGVESCIRCAEEHEQLAMWLEELKARRDYTIGCSTCMDEELPLFSITCSICHNYDKWRKKATTDVPDTDVGEMEE